VSGLARADDLIGPDPRNERVETAREFLQCLAAQNTARMQQLMGASATYTVEGTQGLSGSLKGQGEIKRHLTELVNRIHDTFDLLKFVDWLVGDAYVGCVAEVQMQAERQIYRSREMFLFEFGNRYLIEHLTIFFFDEGASARFFWPET
jgi:ketosteroid isomerase-like protein